MKNIIKNIEKYNKNIDMKKNNNKLAKIKIET